MPKPAESIFSPFRIFERKTNVCVSKIRQIHFNHQKTLIYNILFYAIIESRKKCLTKHFFQFPEGEVGKNVLLYRRASSSPPPPAPRADDLE